MAEQLIPIAFSIPSKLVELTRHLETLVPGAEFRLVGGCIRDMVIGRTPKDYDIITNALPEQLQAAGMKNTMAKFPVFLYTDGELGQVEVACCRTERKIGTGHNAFETKVCQSFEEDAVRRDLTINACSWHHSTPGYMYCYNENTMSDFECGRLRAMSPAFAEDPLRVFRVARFAAQFYTDKKVWYVDGETAVLMLSLRGEIKYLPPDRVRSEFEAAMMKSNNQRAKEQFFNILDNADALDYWLGRKAKIVTTSVETIYLSMSASMLYSTSEACAEAKQRIKQFCDRLHLGLASEMETMTRLLSSISHYHDETDVDILAIVKSMSRGKLSYQTYIDTLLELYDLYGVDTTSRELKYISMLGLVCIALKDMKFTSSDKPAEIKAKQLACVNEFVDLFIGRK